MKTPLSILTAYWGFSSFRSLQAEIIQSVLDGKDTLALLPTGGGKSICFQVPALVMEGMCLVISPLIALMQDQVNHLEEKGIPAVALHSGLTQAEVKQIFEQACEGHYKFLYVSPERLESALFKGYLPFLSINLLAVDEAHCISQWGYDFRPPYLRIAALRAHLPNIPVIALSASATIPVQVDMKVKLLFADNHQVFQPAFERPELSYSCFQVDSKINKIKTILTNVSGSSIIYCNTRKKTKELSEQLQMQGIHADFYHAGLPQEQRTKKQNNWIHNTTSVMVCTNAFGMGIDKPDVRSVIHYDIPDAMENYYQEAGRAGRDGKRAYAILLYHSEDTVLLQQLPDKRFPPIKMIQKIYQALADYLQLPVGSGESHYYDFDLQQFCANFKLDMMVVTNTLKILEQEGHIAFSENLFLPSQVNFICDKVTLHQFQESHPIYTPLSQYLLRTYQGIFDNKVSVFEQQLARMLRQPVATVQEQLKQLAAFGIIAYLPQKETPQLHFILNRASAKYLRIEQDAYLDKKERYRIRLTKMLAYLHEQATCRSKFIGDYFGVPDTKDCGVCDNCLRKKKEQLTAPAFYTIEKQLLETIRIQPQAVTVLLQQYAHITETNIWTVLHLLQEENKIQIDEQGMVNLV